ncbi:putative ubiquitin conjugation factor E4, core [Helianthus anomalus]
MPLPQTCPTEFACMPEHFVEDVYGIAYFVSRIPLALDSVKLVKKCKLFSFCFASLLHCISVALCSFIRLYLVDDFMNFIIMFMACPEYIRNPYLRAKMVEVLNCWMPRRR